MFNMVVSLDRCDPGFEASVLEDGRIETSSNIPSFHFEVITACQQRREILGERRGWDQVPENSTFVSQ